MFQVLRIITGNLGEHRNSDQDKTAERFPLGPTFRLNI